MDGKAEEEQGSWWVACLCAAWCGVCRDWLPQFTAQARANPHMHFAWVDVEDEDETMGEVDIETFPTLLVARGGRVLYLAPIPAACHAVHAAAGPPASSAGAGSRRARRCRCTARPAAGRSAPAHPRLTRQESSYIRQHSCLTSGVRTCKLNQTMAGADQPCSSNIPACKEIFTMASNNQGNQGGKSNRGFASMDPQRQREIASEGGRAAHEKGTAHEFTSEEAREAGRKGGMARSANRRNAMNQSGNSGSGSHASGSNSGSSSHGGGSSGNSQ